MVRYPQVPYLYGKGIGTHEQYTYLTRQVLSSLWIRSYAHGYVGFRWRKQKNPTIEQYSQDLFYGDAT
jgi:hypothetical protein